VAELLPILEVGRRLQSDPKTFKGEGYLTQEATLMPAKKKVAKKAAKKAKK
jgi:hypothetical protein